MAVLLAVPLITYGTLDPCRMLHKEVMRGAAADAAGDGWEMVGVALGAQMIESLVGAMSPLECLAALPEARSGNLDLGSGERRRGSTRERAYFTTLRADLTILRSAQEMHYQTDGDFTYANTVGTLDFVPSSGVNIEVDPASDAYSWAATATHDALSPSVGCAIIYGDVARSRVEYPNTPGGQQVTSTQEGRPVCDD